MWTMPVVWLNFLLLSVFQQFLTAHGEPLMVTRSAEANGYVNAVYFTNWGVSGRNYEPKDLPVSSITHLLYAFVGARADGTVYSIDPEADIQKNLGGDRRSCR
ncbi:hypothetical protein BFJ63_vAg17446 [Fusarium oxysporum f. sp. narcissi]|uniref:GH18 domain-containing protein n=1 Tax=Fusarium oxysporum f. sp. narcissi TaxID=451672 RepID=A0A4Q2V5U6_FUSOX|nr:hypothetical protein BFJ63_vAg17446 [Fusarium oxysporum f. sp. narcissi]